MTPTQRSLNLLRKRGYFAAVTERWNPFARVRQDLFGFIDLVAIRKDETLAVQATTGSNVSARIEKINHLPVAQHWLASPSRKIHIHGWSKRGPRGKRKLWECREINVEAKA